MGDIEFGQRLKPGHVVVITPEAVGVAAGQLLVAAGDQPRRIAIHFQNTSLATIYIGIDATVLAANGRALAPASGVNLGDGGAWTVDVGAGQAFWAIATGAGSALIVVELIGV